MSKKVKQIFDLLKQNFTNPKSELEFSSPFELLVAVILSAQCTDKRVNLVTKELFKVANTPEQMMGLEVSTIEKLIHSCGFYHNKAKFLSEMSADIVNRFQGVVPQTLPELQSLAGVGRKTANVVFAVAFSGQAIAVDTHVFRVSNRLGIVDAKTVLETEKQLMQVLDKDFWSEAHHLLLLHGRYVCKSQNPNCIDCDLKNLCKFFLANQKVPKSD